MRARDGFLLRQFVDGIFDVCGHLCSCVLCVESHDFVSAQHLKELGTATPDDVARDVELADDTLGEVCTRHELKLALCVANAVDEVEPHLAKGMSFQNSIFVRDVAHHTGAVPLVALGEFRNFHGYGF